MGHTEVGRSLPSFRDRILFGIAVMRSLMKLRRPEKGIPCLVIDEARRYALARARMEWITEQLARELRDNLQVKYVSGLSGRGRYPDLPPSQLRSEVGYVVSRLLAFPGVCIYLRLGRPVRQGREEEGVLADLDRLEDVADRYRVDPEVLPKLVRSVSPEEFIEALKDGRKRIQGVQAREGG